MVGECFWFPFRFRLVARSVSSFLMCQIVNEAKFRLSPRSPAAVRDPKRTNRGREPGEVYPSLQALDALASLESLRSNKLYQSIKEHVCFASEFTCNPLHSLRETSVLYTRLVTNLFPDVMYLKAVQWLDSEYTFRRGQILLFFFVGQFMKTILKKFEKCRTTEIKTTKR